MKKIIKGKIGIDNILREAIASGETKNNRKIVNLFAGSKKYNLKNSYTLGIGRIGVAYDGVCEVIAYLNESGEIPDFYNKIIIKDHLGRDGKHPRKRIYLIIEENSSDKEYSLVTFRTSYKTTFRGIAPRSFASGKYVKNPIEKVELVSTCRSGRFGSISYIYLTEKDMYEEIEVTDDTHDGVKKVIQNDF